MVLPVHGSQMTRSAVIFPAPDHDHDSCASAAIAHAEELCAARAQRLTPMRRQVLQALLASHKPLGAYEIMERLARRARPAPITVYRALDFLRDNGLVHRIESRNAFVACVHQSCRQRSGCIPDLRALRRGRRSARRRRRRDAEKFMPRRGLCAEKSGDRDRRRLLALPRALKGCISAAVVALYGGASRRPIPGS